MRAPSPAHQRAQEVRLSLQVPREAVGFVIGRHGETVRNMTHRSGAHIAVDEKHKDNRGPYGIFNIHGTHEQVEAAKALIIEKVNAVLHGRFNYPHTAVRDAVLFSPPNPEADASAQNSSSQGSSTTRSPRASNRRVNSGTSETAGATDPQQDELARDTNGTAQLDSTGQLDSAVETERRSSSSMLGASAESGSPLSVFPALHGIPPPLEMWIPRGKVGMIIGHCGQVINGMQERSGATIVVHNDRKAEDGSKLLTISGPEEPRQMAKSLIQGVLNREPRPQRTPAYETRRARQPEGPHVAQPAASSSAHVRPVASSPSALANLGGMPAAHRAARERPPDELSGGAGPDSARTSLDSRPAALPITGQPFATEPPHVTTGHSNLQKMEPSSIAQHFASQSRTPDRQPQLREYVGHQTGNPILQMSHPSHSATAASHSGQPHFFQQGHNIPLVPRVPYNAMHFAPPQHGRTPFYSLVPTMKAVKVPTSCVGIVIGKGGETIRDLQTRSGAYIKVTPDREANADDTERMIFISGSVPAIELAHNLLNDIVNEGLGRSYRDGVEPGRGYTEERSEILSHAHKPQQSGLFQSNSPQNVQHAYLGMEASKENEPPSEEAPGKEGTTKPGIPKDVSDENESDAHTSGISPATREPSVSAEGDTNESQQGIANFVADQPQSEGDVKVVAPPVTSYPSSSITLLMNVPDVKVGVIIGKRGQTIRELQQRSGARIVISKKMDMSKQDNPREVRITGPKPFAERAMALIKEKIAGETTTTSLENSPGNMPHAPAPVEIPQLAFRLPHAQYGHQHIAHPMPGRPVQHSSVPVPGAPAFQGFQGQVPYMTVDQRFEAQPFQNPNVGDMHAMRNRFAQQAFHNQQHLHAMQQQALHQQAMHQQALQQQQSQAQMQAQAQVAMTLQGYAPRFQVHPAQFQQQPQVAPFLRSPQPGSDMPHSPPIGFGRGSLGSGEEMEEYQSEIQAGVHLQQGQNVIPGRAYHEAVPHGDDMNELIAQTGRLHLPGAMGFPTLFIPQYQYQEGQHFDGAMGGSSGLGGLEDNKQTSEGPKSEGTEQAEVKRAQRPVETEGSNNEPQESMRTETPSPAGAALAKEGDRSDQAESRNTKDSSVGDSGK